MSDNREAFTVENMPKDLVQEILAMPVKTKNKYKLADLLNKCDLTATAHPEVNWGPPVGNEII